MAAFTKYWYLIVGAMLILGCQNSNYNWYSGNFVEARSMAGSKLVLVEFYTDT